MKFDWMDCGSGYYRCTSTEPVTVKAFNFGNTGVHEARITDMGYVIVKAGAYEGSTYGSVNPEAPSKGFNTLDKAKAYVEEQAIAGIAINRLTR
jgi:hypothetical protein